MQQEGRVKVRSGAIPRAFRGLRAWVGGLLALGLMAQSSPVMAQSDASTRIDRLEKELAAVLVANQESLRRQEILTKELRKVRDSLTLPEETKFKAQYGMGPAASKVYGKERGYSIGGYGQVIYSAQVEDKNPTTGANSFDALRFVLYNGYKFSDKIILNSELEVEHGSTGKGGEVSVEFAQLEFFINKHFNVRAGLLLVPMGFINEVHEPTFYHGNERPEVERNIIPATWRENGIGAFGQIAEGWTYRAYAVASLKASAFTAAGIRAGRQSGAQSRADDFSVVARTDYDTGKGLVVGGSIYAGDQGQDEILTVDSKGTKVKPEVSMTLTEVHAQYRKKGLEFRALGAWTILTDATILSQARQVAKAAGVSERMHGYYVEGAYDVLRALAPKSDQYLAAFFRYEALDTQVRVPYGFAPDLTLAGREVRTTGLTYKPHPQVVIKLDHRDHDQRTGRRADEFNLGMGWIF